MRAAVSPHELFIVKINEYVGKDIYNYDTLTTTGGSINLQAGKNPIGGVGVNQGNRDKEGITRHTVLGDIEIGSARGTPINKDITKANEVTKDTHSSTNIYVEGQTIDYITNPSRFKEDLEIAILEGKSTVEGAIKKIDNILNGSNNSDISEPERRRYEEIKEDILRFKTAPEMDLIAEGDLGNKRVQEELGIGGKFNPDDANLPKKIRERIEEARAEGKEVTYFYDKVTGKIYINENADENTIRSGIAREWGIRDRFEKGKAKPNSEGDLKATVAGEIAYSEIENRLKGKSSKGINPNDFEYGIFDTKSEITGDFTIKHIEKGKKELGAIGSKLKEGNIGGAFIQGINLVGKVGKVLGDDTKNLVKGGSSADKTIKESKEAIKEEIVKPVQKKIREEKEKDKKRKQGEDDKRNRLFKEGKPKNLEELKEYQSSSGKLPENTKIVFEYQDGKKVVFNSFDELKYGTAEEAKKVEDYVKRINQKEAELKLAKRNGDIKAIKRIDLEINELSKEQHEAVLREQRERISPLGPFSQTGELVYNAKNYKDGVLTVKGEEYSNAMRESTTAVGMAIIDHSGAMDYSYSLGVDKSGIGRKESISGIEKDNKNNPEIVREITNKKIPKSKVDSYENQEETKVINSDTYKNYELKNNSKNLAVSQENKKSIERNTGQKLENIKLHEGKQGKHVIGHNNYQSGKSEIDMETAKKILEEYKGTGEIIEKNNQIKEIINTNGKYQGVYRDSFTGTKYNTSRFTIHYDKKGGAHLVPAHPTGQ